MHKYTRTAFTHAQIIIQKEYKRGNSISFVRSFILIPFLLLTLWGVNWASAQCLLYPVPLEERVQEAQVIFEGEVLGSRSFWNLNQTKIHTAHLVKVYKLFKGTISGNLVVMVTEGGIVGNRKLEVRPALRLSEGNKGIFMATLWQEPVPYENIQAFIPYSDEQGFIELDYFNDQGKDPFNIYPSIQEGVYHKLGSLLGKPYSIIQELAPPQLGLPDKKTQISPFAPTNITFTPASLSAGTGATLTINGNNFGTMTGSAKVQLKNADDGGATFIDIPASYITSWTNTQITLIVPNNVTGGTPGTGQIKVIDSGNAQGTSAATLTVNYNVVNTSAGHLIRLYNENTSGGYTFRYNTTFASNAARLASFRRALESWRCATFVNFGEQCTPTLSAACNDQNDNINLVSMDATGCLLAAGVLGKCYSSFVSPGACPANAWYVADLDLIFKSTTSWQYGPALATGTQYDFESVALHELGHAHQLDHVINNTIVMHYAIANGQNLRTLNPGSDIAGGNFVMTQSTGFTVCSPSYTPMISVNTSTCALGPASAFTAAPNSLCQNQNATVTLSSTPISGATYSWNFGGGAAPATANTGGPHNVSWSTAGTKTLTLNVTNNGCIGSSQAVVTVNSGSGATANIISPPSAACVNQVVTLNATPGPAGTTYTWTCSGCLPAPGNTAGPLNVSWSTTGAKVVTLTVTAPGCPTPAMQTITVNVTSPVTATILSPSSSSACANQNVTFQANTGGGTNYSWSCDGCTPALGNTEGPFTASWTATGPKTINLTVNIPGCTNSTASMVVTVNNAPTSNITGTNSGCINQTVSVTGSGTGSGVTYSWTCDGCFSSPPLGTTTGTFNLSWSSAGVKTVTLSANQPGCSPVVSSFLVTVASGAAASIIQPTNNATTCVNQNLPLQATAGAATYTWACDGCSPAPGNTAGVFLTSWATQGIKTITLTATSPGCGSSTASVVVNVNPSPTASITSPTASTTCTGTSLSFQGAGSGTSFLWNCDGCTPTPPTTTGPFNASWTTAGTKTVTLNVNASGCGAAAIASVIVTVLNGAGASITSPMNSTTCVNTNTNLQAVAGASSYAWNCDGCNPAPGASAGPHNIQWTTPGVKTITLTATNPGCPTSTANVFVTVNSTPVANITSPAATTICTQNNVNLQASPGATTYTWGCGGCVPTPGNTAGPFSVSWSSSGVKTITLQAANPGCAAITASPVLVTVNPNITATILSPASSVLCQDNGATLNATPGATSYAWSCGDCTPAPGASSGPFSITWSSPGVKTIQLNVTNTGCGASTASVVVTVNAPPSATIVGPLSAICVNNTAILQASNAGINSYVWNCDGCSGIGSGPGPFTVAWSTPGVKSVALTVTNPGCSPFTAAPLLVTVNQTPPAVVTQPAPPTTCVDQVVNLEAAPGADIYTWSCDGCVGALTSTAGPFPVSWTGAGAKTIQLQVANAGCPAAMAAPYIVTVDPALNPGVAVLPAAGVCPSSPATLSVTGGPFSGATYSWNLGAGATALSSTTSSSVTASWGSPGLKLVSVTVTKNGCSYSATQTVNIYTVPEVPIPGVVTGRCGAGSITLSALPGPGGDLVHWYTSPTATIPVATGATFTSQPITTHTVFYYATQNTTTSCIGAKASIIGHVYTTPASPSVQSITRCGPGEITFTVTMGNPAGKSVALYVTPTGGAPLDYDLSAQFVLTTFLQTNTQYYVEAIDSSGLCASTRASVMGNLVNKPATPIVQDRSICGPGKVSVNGFMANPPGEELRIYESSSGGQPIQSASISPYIFEFDVASTATYFVESYSVSSGCFSEVRAPLVINVNTPPPPPYVVDVSRCTSGQVTFTAEGLPAAMDKIYVYTSENSEFPVAIGNQLPFFYSPNIASTTTYYFEAFDSRTGCRSVSRAKAEARLIGLPSIGLPSREIARCGMGMVTFTINLQNISAGTQLYLRDQPGGIIWAAASASPFMLTTPPISVTTSYYIEAIDNATGCSSGVFVEARVDKQPASPNVLPVPSSCGGNPVTIQATSGTPAGDEFVLYTVQGGGEPIEVRPNGLMPFTLYNITSNTTYFVAARSGSCESARLPAYVTLTSIPAPNVPGVTRCGSGPVRLTANVFVSGGEVRLYDQAEGGTILTSSNVFPFELVLPLVTTNATYYANVYHPTKNCESIRVPVEVKILEAPEPAIAPSAVTRCGPGSVTITASFLNATVGYALHLYDTPQGGLPLQIDSIAPYRFTIDNVTAASAFFIETVDRNNVCATGERVRVLVDIAPPPAAPQTLPVARCGSGWVTLSAFMGSPGGTSINLYTLPTGGSPVSVNYDFPYSFPNISVTQTTTFYVASAIGDCESKRVELIATVLPSPTAPVVNNASRCGAGTLTFTVGASGDGVQVDVYETEEANLPLQSALQAPFLFSLNVTTTVTHYVSVRNIESGCASAKIPVVLTVNSIPSPVFLPNSAVCNQETVTVNLMPSAGMEVLILPSSAPGATPVAGTANCRTSVCPVTLPLGATQNSFFVTNRNAATGCQSPVSRFTVLKYASPGEPVAENVRVCQGANATLSAKMGNPAGSELRLYTQPTGGAPIAKEQAQEATFAISANGSVAYYVASYDAQTGCESSRREIMAQTLPSLGLASQSDIKVCEGEPVTIPVNASFSGNTVSVRLFTSSFASEPISERSEAPYTFVQGSTSENATYYIDALDRATGCSSAKVSVSVNVLRKPLEPAPLRLEVCGSGSISFTAAQPGGGTALRLYSQAAGGIFIQSSPTSPATFTLANASSGFYYIANYNAETECESKRLPVSVNVIPVPSVPAVSESVIRLCRPGTATILAGMGSPAGELIRLYTAPTGGLALAQASSPYTFTLQNQTSSTTYYLEAVSGSCSSASRLAVEVLVDPNSAPTAPTAPDVFVCSASSPVFTLLGVPSGATALLYSESIGGNPLAMDATSPYTLSAPLINTTTTFYLASRLSDCESGVRTPVVAHIEPKYSVPSAAPVTRCGSGSVTLTLNLGSIPAPVVKLFSSPSGGSVLASGSHTITTPAVTQTTIFYLEAGQGGSLQCNKQRGAVAVQVVDLPVSPAVNSVRVCVNTPVTVPVPQPSAPGVVYQLYSVSGGGLPVSFVSSAPWQFNLPAQTQTTTYFVETLANGCTSAVRTGFIVEVNYPDLPPTVSPNPITRCGAGSVSFTVNALGEVRAWDSFGQLVQTVSSPPYVVKTGILNSSTHYSVRSFNRATGCWSEAARVNIQILQKPLAPIGSARAVCPGSSASITVSAPSAGNYTLRLFSQASGGGILASSGMAPYVLNSPAVTANTVYYLEAIDNVNGCVSDRSSVTVQVENAPSPPSVSGMEICQPGKATITVGAALGSRVRLYSASVGGNPIQERSAAPYAFEVFASSPATYYVSVTSGAGCESLRTPVAISVGANIFTSVSPVTRCGAGAVTFTAFTNSPNGVGLYSDMQSDIPLAVSTLSPYTLTVPFSVATTSTFYVQALGNSGCRGDRASAVVSIFSVPSAPVASNVSVCEGGSVTLSASMGPVAGNSIQLYDANAPTQLLGVASREPYAFTLSNIRTTTRYFLVASNGVCASSRTLIEVGVIPRPAAPVYERITSCAGAVSFSPSILGSPSGNALRLYTVASGGAIAAEVSQFPFSFTVNAITNVTYYVESVLGVCSSARVPVIISVLPELSVPPIAPMQLCGGGVVSFTVGAPSGSIVSLYENEQAQAPIMETSNPPYLVASSFVGRTTELFVEIRNGNCQSQRVPVRVIVTPVPSVPFAQHVERCGPGSVSFTAIVQGDVDALNLYSENNALLQSVNASTAVFETPTVQTTTTFYLTSGKSGCESARLPIMAVVGKCETNDCTAPRGLFVTNGSSTSVDLLWGAVNNAVCYQVTYRSLDEVGTEHILLVPAPSTTASIQGLRPGSVYSISVRANCTSCSRSSGVTSSEVAIEFTTPRAKVYNALAENGLFSVYPNPSSGIFTLSANVAKAGEVNVVIWDSRGKEVIRLNQMVEEGGNNIDIDLQSLPAGVYLLQYRLEGQSGSLKLLKR